MAETSTASANPRVEDERVPLLIQRHVIRRTSRPRRVGLCCWLFIVTVLASIFLSLAIVLILFKIDLRKSLPAIGTSLKAPGIGLDFGPSAATLAYRFENGSSVGVTSIKYTNDEIEMMERLSERRHFPDPWRTYCHDPWNWPHNWRRNLLRRLGLPSTKDVARLRDILVRVKDAVKQSDTEWGTFKATVPMFPGICEADISEAGSLVGLKKLPDVVYEECTHEMFAAFAGVGQGLCAHYMNALLCKEEESRLPKIRTLAVSYSHASLALDLMPIKRAVGDFESEMYAIVDFNLGSRVESPRGTPEAAEHWRLIGQRVADMMHYHANPSNETLVDHLLLLGESGGNPDFRRVVRQTVIDNQEAIPVGYNADPVYVAAQGAAEMGKRQSDQEYGKNHPNAQELNI